MTISLDRTFDPVDRRRHRTSFGMTRASAVVVLLTAAAACRDGAYDPVEVTEPDVPQVAATLDKASVTRPGRLAGTDVASGDVTAAAQSSGNAFYSVYVEDDVLGWKAGLYTVGTGVDHPVTQMTGASQNVLFGGAGGFPGTTYTTVRSYTSGSDYVQGPAWVETSFEWIELGQFATSVVPAGGTGFTTTYEVTEPDQLTVQQTVKANGTTFENSSVEVTTVLTNNGASAVEIGIRYLWDFQIGLDDGPAFFPRDPDSGPVITEAEYPDPPFGFFKLEDNDRNTPTPLFAVYGTQTGPSGVTPPPTGADMIRHVQWLGAYGSAFDYTVDPDLIVSTPDAPWLGGSGGDNAVLTYAGESAENAVVIEPGSSFTFSHSIFSAPSDGTPPPFDDDLGNSGPRAVAIDIKPGSDPNSILVSPRGNARIAVAVMTGTDFDAADVDPSTVTLGDEVDTDTPVAARRNGTLFASLEDVDRDGRLDLVLHFERAQLIANGDLTPATTHLVLLGSTTSGTPIRGEDAVRVIDN